MNPKDEEIFSTDVKQVIVVRHDLGMRRGKAMAQTAHASWAVFLNDGVSARIPAIPTWTGMELHIAIWPQAWQWFRGGTKKICVRAESEEELLALFRQAKTAQLPCALVTDAGHTEFHGEPTITALAIGPHDSEKIDKITGHLKLL